MSDSVLPALDARARRLLWARGLLWPAVPPSDPRGVCWVVPKVTLWELVADESYVDLLDIDIQGLELDVLESASRLVDQRVKRVHVGTHSREIEDGLPRLFSGLG